jgi:arylsulfatase A-like enzyme
MASAMALVPLLASVCLAQRPTLVVAVTIDQLRPDYLLRWERQFTGGYARFLRDGAVFTNAFHDHANTETAPGHASILSGRFPYSTGIIANSLGVETPTAPLIGFPGTGASPFRFRGTVLADWMRTRDPRTRVLSVSRKDRSAILTVGRDSSNTVIWYAPRAGRFTTSTWYGTSIPAWVQAFNHERGVFALAGRPWTLLLPESAYPERDSVAGEPRTDMLFPHVAATDSARLVATVERTPWMDSLTLALAWRGVRSMGLGGDSTRTDLLSVSLSTTDAIGHRWGPESRELHDQVLRTDRFLGVFLDSLFALVGRERVALVLTSDHGVAGPPEIPSTFDRGAEPRRLPSATFRPAVAALRNSLRAAGLDTTALYFTDQVLWIDRNKLLGAQFNVEPVVRTFVASVRDIPGVARVDLINDLASVDTTRDAIARRLLRMFRPGEDSFPGVRALVAVTLAPFVRVGTGDVGLHGTPHDYDARVPVVFLGAPFVPGQWSTKINVVDIAPTLAAVIGVTPGERLDGRALREVIR